MKTKMSTEQFLQLKSLLLQETRSKQVQMNFLLLLLGIMAVLGYVIAPYFGDQKNIMMLCSSAVVFIMGIISATNNTVFKGKEKLKKLEKLYQEGTDFEDAAQELGLVPK